MAKERYLVVNADDFGLSPCVNEGIIKAHEAGIVTSASLMVRYPAAVEAARYAGEHPGLSLGLHVDLAEWEYRSDEWVLVYQVVPLDDAEAVAGEVARQLGYFRDLVGRNPSHIDSHQHMHREEPLRSVIAGVAGDLGIPARLLTPSIRYLGEFYGQSSTGYPLPEFVSAEALASLLKSLPEGITELACHPGLCDDLDSVYRIERALEVEALCDARVREAIEQEGIHLCSFSDLPPSLTH